VQGPAADSTHRDEVSQKLADVTGGQITDVSVSDVGPSWGKEITKSAERALVIFLIAILFYLSIRLEWKMAVGAVLAMIHDVIISVGVYSVFQLEVTPPTVIAFLTILGYSIYDTIVVFDKVKENQARPGMASRMTFTDLASRSMNQVLLRSVNTSIVAIIPVLSMLIVGALILGAVTLEEFSIALLVGMISGAYSSIFVAAPIVVWLKEREPRNRQLTQRLASVRPAGSRSVDPSANARDDAEAMAEDDALADASGTAGTGAARSGGGSTPVGPASGVIPPRPRKKGKKR